MQPLDVITTFSSLKLLYKDTRNSPSRKIYNSIPPKMNNHVHVFSTISKYFLTNMNVKHHKRPVLWLPMQGDINNIKIEVPNCLEYDYVCDTKNILHLSLDVDESKHLFHSITIIKFIRSLISD